MKDVKYEEDLEVVACPTHCERGRWRMDCGAYEPNVDIGLRVSDEEGNVLADSD